MQNFPRGCHIYYYSLGVPDICYRFTKIWGGHIIISYDSGRHLRVYGSDVYVYA